MSQSYIGAVDLELWPTGGTLLSLSLAGSPEIETYPDGDVESYAYSLSEDLTDTVGASDVVSTEVLSWDIEVNAVATSKNTIRIFGYGNTADRYDLRWRRVGTPSTITTQLNVDWVLDRISKRDSVEMNQEFTYRNNGAGIRIYVLDNGIRITHEQFADIEFLPGFNSWDQGSEIDPSWDHGTVITGAAVGNTLGVAKGPTVIPIKMWGDGIGWPNWWTAGLGVESALQWVIDNHPKGTSGVMLWATARLDVGTTIGDACEILFNEIMDIGIVVVGAAGDVGHAPFLPSYMPRAIMAGQSTPMDSRLRDPEGRPTWDTFSGSNVLWAPAVDMVVAGSADGLSESDTQYRMSGGTSLSAGLISGVAAGLLQENPSLGHDGAKAVLYAQSTKGVVSDVDAGDPGNMVYSLVSTYDWSEFENIGADEYTLQYLEPGEEYELQLRVVHDETAGDWSTTEIVQTIDILEDTAGITDSLTTQLSYGRAITDTAGATDTVSDTVIVDGAGVYSNTEVNLELWPTGGTLLQMNTVGTADIEMYPDGDVVTDLTVIGDISDSVGSTDTIGAFLTLSRDISDTAGATDTISDMVIAESEGIYSNTEVNLELWPTGGTLLQMNTIGTADIEMYPDAEIYSGYPEGVYAGDANLVLNPDSGYLTRLQFDPISPTLELISDATIEAYTDGAYNNTGVELLLSPNSTIEAYTDGAYNNTGVELLLSPNATISIAKYAEIADSVGIDDVMIHQVFHPPGFNKPLNNWNVSNVTNMKDMFKNATSFNQPIDTWNVEAVLNMDGMFLNASSFNQDLTNLYPTNISTEPTDFATGSGLAPGNRPNWGMSPPPFIMRVKTDNVGQSENTQYILSTGDGVFDYTVDWGDGVVETFTTSNNQLHTYATAGEYNISISGTFPHMSHDDYSLRDPLKIIDVLQWGIIEWGSMVDMFRGTALTSYSAIDEPNLSNVANMETMFFEAILPVGFDVSNWNISNVNAIGGMFMYSTLPAGFDVSQWNVSNVTTMNSVFFQAILPVGFDVSLWNVGNVTTMNSMFHLNTTLPADFNISQWNVSNVAGMTQMFWFANIPDNFDISTWFVPLIATIPAGFGTFNGTTQLEPQWGVSPPA